MDNISQLQSLFSIVDLDSAGLTLLGAIAHPCGTVGTMTGEVTRGGVAVANFQLIVEESGAPSQADIDLSSLAGGIPGSSPDCCCGPGVVVGNIWRITKGGYALFYVASGSGTYGVRLTSALAKTPGFDSTKLGPGDVFTASPLRPGRYQATNGAHHTAEVQVLYPNPSGKHARKPLEPVRVRVTEKGFEPAKIAVHGAQGIVFAIETSARIQLQLKEPDDGPNGPRTPRRPGSVRSRLIEATKTKL
jgi:hypothetical protein